MQYAWVVLSSVASPAYNIFGLYLAKQTTLKKIIKYEMCFVISSTTFVWNISHYKKNLASRDHIYIYIDLHVKYPIFLIDLNVTKFSWQFHEKMIKYIFSRKLVQCEHSCSMWTDRRTGMKLIVTFHNFGKVRKALLT